MRIGYDAKWYFDGPASGRIVVRRHLDALARLAGPHSLVAILDSKHRGQALDGDADELERTWMWGSNNLVANTLLLDRVARASRLDVVIVHNFAPLSRHCPSVAFVHDILYREFPQFYTARERLYFSPLIALSRLASRICTPSDSERQRLVAAGVASASRVDVVPLGVDESFRPREQHDPRSIEDVRRQLRLPERFLLFVGRINDRKNLTSLLNALPLINDREIPLVVVGERDWKSADPAPLCRTLGIEARVHFVGAVDHDRLPLVYSLATAFVFPSWAESFGLPPLEALRSGVPVIVSRATSLPEVCGDAAIYCDPESPRSIAEATSAVLADPALRRELSSRGIARAAQYTWAHSARLLLNSAQMAITPQ